MPATSASPQSTPFADLPTTSWAAAPMSIPNKIVPRSSMSRSYSSLGDGVDLATRDDVLGGRGAPHREVRGGAVRVEGGLVGVELVEHEVVVIAGVHGHVEVSAAGLVGERTLRLLGDRSQERLPMPRLDPQRHNKGKH